MLRPQLPLSIRICTGEVDVKIERDSDGQTLQPKEYQANNDADLFL